MEWYHSNMKNKVKDVFLSSKLGLIHKNGTTKGREHYEDTNSWGVEAPGVKGSGRAVREPGAGTASCSCVSSRGSVSASSRHQQVPRKKRASVSMVARRIERDVCKLLSIIANLKMTLKVLCIVILLLEKKKEEANIM